MSDRTPHIWSLRNALIFENQSESMYESADSRASEITFERGDFLPCGEGRHGIIYVIIEGKIKLRSVTEGGKEIILDVLSTNDTFGPLECVVTGGSNLRTSVSIPAEAVALSKGAALRFDFQEFSELVKRRPALVVNLTRFLGMRQKRFELRLARLLYRTSLGKVAGLLSELGERYGVTTPKGMHISLRLTHQEMASSIGVKRETVSEAIAELEQMELISVQKGHIYIVKPAELDKVM